MKALTYGTVPSFEEFKAAFVAAVNAGLFHFTLSESDARMFEATGIERLYRLDARQLYSLLDSLGAIAKGHVSHGAPWTDAEMEWAGEFASGILTTLGFEWV